MARWWRYVAYLPCPWGLLYSLDEWDRFGASIDGSIPDSSQISETQVGRVMLWGGSQEGAAFHEVKILIELKEALLKHWGRSREGTRCCYIRTIWQRA